MKVDERTIWNPIHHRPNKFVESNSLLASIMWTVSQTLLVDGYSRFYIYYIWFRGKYHNPSWESLRIPINYSEERFHNRFWKVLMYIYNYIYVYYQYIYILQYMELQFLWPHPQCFLKTQTSKSGSESCSEKLGPSVALAGNLGMGVSSNGGTQ